MAIHTNQTCWSCVYSIWFGWYRLSQSECIPEIQAGPYPMWTRVFEWLWWPILWLIINKTFYWKMNIHTNQTCWWLLYSVCLSKVLGDWIIVLTWFLCEQGDEWIWKPFKMALIVNAGDPKPPWPTPKARTANATGVLMWTLWEHMLSNKFGCQHHPFQSPRDTI